MNLNLIQHSGQDRYRAFQVTEKEDCNVGFGPDWHIKLLASVSAYQTYMVKKKEEPIYFDKFLNTIQIVKF